MFRCNKVLPLRFSRTKWFCAFLLLVLIFPTSQRVEANVVCEWFWYCVYESPGFRITVVDGESGKPIPDVHALATWVQYGPHGGGGPLMAQEAVSGPDGALIFQPWGPLHGSKTGLELNQDPVISLFRPGYKLMLINNAPGRDPTARARGLTQNGRTFSMEPFRGASEQWVKELEGAAFPMSGPSASAPENVPRAYLSRKQRVKTEIEKLPPNRKDVARLLDAVQRSMKFLEEGQVMNSSVIC